MGDRINNMEKMMNNPQKRNLYFMLIGLAVFTLGAGYYFSTKNNAPQASSGAVVANVPQVGNTPGSSTNPQYNKEVAAANEQGANQALKGDGTFVPTLTNQNQLSNNTPLEDIERDKQRQIESDRVKMEEERLKNEQLTLQKQEEQARQIAAQPVVLPVASLSGQSIPVKKNKYSIDDYMLINTVSNAWHNKAPSSEFDYSKSTVKNNTTASSNGNGANSNTASQSNVMAATNSNNVTPLPLAKAGTVFNAILETAINSDEPSPVLAKIVSGELKGTKLIGQIQTVGEKVVLQFSTANIPNMPSSIKLSAYAVNPTTSRTALADDIDHHYFLKYGVMLASSFLGGYADAISRKNSTTTVNPLGGVTVTQGELSNSDINKQALGSVGKAVSSDAQQQFQNIKPTIYVNSGSAIGILLTDDLVLKN